MNGPGRYLLGPDHEPVACDDVLTWARWFETSHAERVVAQDTIGDYFVSTVFLGLDHNWGDGPPLLWETMIFAPEKPRPYTSPSSDLYCRRYTSHAEAVAGHAEALEQASGWTLVGWER